MRTVFLRSSLLALATCALAAAASATNPSEQHDPLDLDKRTFGLSLIPLSPCGIFQGGMSGISAYSSLLLNLNFGFNAGVRCPLRFRCDGSGLDGHQYDINGQAVPSSFPSTWLYFGIEVGWQPPATFNCGSSWNVPTAWCPSAHLAPWFQPGPGVSLTYSSSLSIPSWWLPSIGWSCSGNLGIGGYGFDPNGQGPPTGASGFLYFGAGQGWLPPAGLTIDVNFVFPSGCGDLHAAIWWSPPFEWVPPPNFGNCPSWWTCRRCQTPTPIVVLPATTTTSTSTVALTTTTSVTPAIVPTTTSSSAAASTIAATTSTAAATTAAQTTSTAAATTTAQATTTNAQVTTTASTTDAQTTTQATTTQVTTPCGQATTTSNYVRSSNDDYARDDDDFFLDFHKLINDLDIPPCCTDDAS
ncbi:BQ2448_3938 [Microbotryum intermedium]|uniref:BQ2448_3938 protein n=1 Tax=Microbotryum intermedium TaxID=269621 RepID=A0A238FJS1_9BASI|nr:BQ2448_3938 [Microbotryum intermedium]